MCDRCVRVSKASAKEVLLGMSRKRSEVVWGEVALARRRLRRKAAARGRSSGGMMVRECCSRSDFGGAQLVSTAMFSLAFLFVRACVGGEIC